MSTPDAPHGPGRPRGYDRAAALDAALDVFWRRGYAAASLEELTAAMGLSRSSFYGCFGDKRAALAAAFDAYNQRGLQAMARAAEAAGPDGTAAARAVLRHLAAPLGDPRGCFLLNAVAELSVGDAELAAAGRAQIARIEDLVARCLAPGHGAGAPGAARAVVALGLGASALRKAGVPAAQLEEMLAAAEILLRAPAP